MSLLKGFDSVTVDSAASKHQTELNYLHQQNFSWIRKRKSTIKQHKSPNLRFYLHSLCQGLMSLVGKSLLRLRLMGISIPLCCGQAQRASAGAPLQFGRLLWEAVGDPFLSRLLELMGKLSQLVFISLCHTAVGWTKRAVLMFKAVMVFNWQQYWGRMMCVWSYHVCGIASSPLNDFWVQITEEDYSFSRWIAFWGIGSLTATLLLSRILLLVNVYILVLWKTFAASSYTKNCWQGISEIWCIFV